MSLETMAEVFDCFSLRSLSRPNSLLLSVTLLILRSLWAFSISSVPCSLITWACPSASTRLPLMRTSSLTIDRSPLLVTSLPWRSSDSLLS
ncbi:hypothetical protein D3C81_1932330 [compost metagenome]